MKALVKSKSEPGIWMADVPKPEIAPDEVLIRVHETSICGTDMHIYKWDQWAQANVPVPMVIGHEYGGEVVEIGSTVRRVRAKATLLATEVAMLVRAAGIWTRTQRALV